MSRLSLTAAPSRYIDAAALTELRVRQDLQRVGRAILVDPVVVVGENERVLRYALCKKCQEGFERGPPTSVD